MTNQAEPTRMDIEDGNMQTTEPGVECPSCKTRQIWSTKNPHRPFCSESCRNRDFIAWANEDHRLAGNSQYDDLLSGDLHSLAT